MNPPMSLSDDGLEAIKRREGFRSSAYPDASGYSIGYGHYGAAIGDTCTTEQAAQWLCEDAQGAESAINSWVEVPLTQGQFDALVSFIYNVGVPAFKSSTLLKLLNEGQYEQARGQLSRWVFSSGQESPALEARRKDEGSQFDGASG